MIFYRKLLSPFRRLTVQLGCLFLITAIIPLLFLGIFSANLLRQKLLAHVREINLVHAEKVSSQIDNFLDRTLAELEVLAEARPFWSGDFAGSHNDMDRFLASRKGVLKIELVDQKGDERVIISSTGLFLKESFSNVQKTLAFKETSRGKVYTGDIFFRPGAGQAIKISVPIMDPSRKRVAGMLSADISLKNILEESGALRVGRHGSVFIVDQNGVVIAHNDFSFVLARKDASHIPEVRHFLQGKIEWETPHYRSYTTLTGEKVFGAHAYISSRRWGVVAETPYSETMRPYEKLVYRLVFFIAGIVVLAATVICMAIFFLLRPVSQLTRAASKIARGEMDVRIPVQRLDELGFLIRTFNIMSRTLGETVDALKRKAFDLRKSESRYRNIFQTVAVAIWEEDFTALKEAVDELKRRGITDIKTYLDQNPGFLEEAAKMIRVKDVNRAALALYKVEKREELMRKIDRTFTPDSFKVFREELVALFEGERFFESEATTKDLLAGTPVNTIMTISFPEPGSSFDSILVCMMDITARKKAEEERSKLGIYLENIIDSMPSVIVGVDGDGIVTQWNRSAETETGLARTRAKGRQLNDVYPGLAGEMAKVRQTILDREVQTREKVLVETGVDARYNDITVYPLITGEGAVIRVDDVTERVRIEEMIIQSEKMLSVGGLAAGMAHEINNPLAGILQSVQVLKNRLSPTLPKNREVAEECGITLEAINLYLEKRNLPRMITSIMESGLRAEKVVQNILSFSRKGSYHFIRSDLTLLLEKTVELASGEYNLKKRYNFRNITIKREYEEALPMVPCEPSKIQQVFLNILKNGAHAMIDAMVREPCFTLRAYQKASMAVVEIEDNGSGMEEGVRKRVFEPFYTTKEVGVGTGLGMSVSYFIISENHGGKLYVESIPGKGSTFVIQLPLENREKEEASGHD